MRIYDLAVLGALLALFNLGAIQGATFAQTSEDDLIQEATEITEQDRQDSEVQEITFTIQSNPDSTFNNLLGQAAGQAQMFIDQGFTENSSISGLVVNILGERNGVVIPLLQARVTRSDWRTRPEISLWANYSGRSAMQLLGYVSPDTVSSSRQTSVNARGGSNANSRARQIFPGNLNIGSGARQRTANSRDSFSNSRNRLSSSPSSAATRQPSTRPPSATGSNVSPRFSLEDSDPGYR